MTAVQGFPPIYRGFPHSTVSEREREREPSNVSEREKAACMHVWLKEPWFKEPSLHLFVAASPAPAPDEFLT